MKTLFWQIIYYHKSDGVYIVVYFTFVNVAVYLTNMKYIFRGHSKSMQRLGGGAHFFVTNRYENLKEVGVKLTLLHNSKVFL